MSLGTQFDDWCELRRYGFPHPWARYRPAVYVAAGLLASAAAKEAATFLLAVTALLVGYQQWRDARQEASLEKYYERLDLPNRRREALYPDGAQTAYVFAELDNLEYVIEKYALGYATVGLAARGLRTFRARCYDPVAPDAGAAFRTQAQCWVRDRTVGYRPATCAVVTAVLAAPEAPAGYGVGYGAGVSGARLHAALLQRRA